MPIHRGSMTRQVASKAKKKEKAKGKNEFMDKAKAGISKKRNAAKKQIQMQKAMKKMAAAGKKK